LEENELAFMGMPVMVVEARSKCWMASSTILCAMDGPDDDTWTSHWSCPLTCDDF
jgi:hypothetical protein